MARIKVRFWGVRGSVPVSSPETMRYGGNTSCIEITSDDDTIICDAGTGIRALGRKMCKTGKRVRAAVLISHVHWDHIAGLPFFEPLFSKKNSFEIIGPDPERSTFKKALLGSFSPPYFPISLKDVAADVHFKTLSGRPFRCGKINVRPYPLSHPGGALGWRLEFPGGGSLVYISDNEPGEDAKKIARWAYGADVMIHDSQYTPALYRERKGWGHSPYTYPVSIAIQGNVGKLILNHFDPTSTDRMLEAMLKSARKIIKERHAGLKCELAREGKIIHL